MVRRLLEIADEIRAIATTGLHFTEGDFDRERYEKLMALASRLASRAGAGSIENLDRIYSEADLGYTTPKLDVRMAVFRGDGVLLVREKSDGRWCLPGGYADIGDTPSEAAVRETAEEASVAVRATGLVGVYDNRINPESPPHLFHIYKLVFLGELHEPAAEPGPGPETDAAAFHPTADLPDLSLGRTLPLHIQAATAFAAGQTPTRFD